MSVKDIAKKNSKLYLFFTQAFNLLMLLLFYNRVYNRGLNNKIINKGSILYGVKFYFRGNNNIVTLGHLSRFKNVKFIIIGDSNKIIIGEHCTINDSEFWAEDSSNVIELNNIVRFNGCHLAATEGKSIKIGNDCLFSKGIDVRTGDSHSIINNITRERLNPAKSIVIQEHVWIGKNATVLKGVTVGSHSIIGSNSMVVKDVPVNCIVGGSPAMIIKDNVDWVIERL